MVVRVGQSNGLPVLKDLLQLDLYVNLGDKKNQRIRGETEYLLFMPICVLQKKSGLLSKKKKHGTERTPVSVSVWMAAVVKAYQAKIIELSPFELSYLLPLVTNSLNIFFSVLYSTRTDAYTVWISNVKLTHNASGELISFFLHFIFGKHFSNNDNAHSQKETPSHREQEETIYGTSNRNANKLSNFFHCAAARNTKYNKHTHARAQIKLMNAQMYWINEVEKKATHRMADVWDRYKPMSSLTYILWDQNKTFFSFISFQLLQFQPLVIQRRHCHFMAALNTGLN